MSSPGLLRTLLRTSSSAPTANDSPSPKISTSPSFSDFSFNASADFDDVDHSSNCTATPRSLDGRASMESMESRNSTPSALARRSIDAASLRAEMRGLLFGSKGSPGPHDLRRASVPTPAAFHQKSHNPGQAKPEATAASTAPEKARRRQKIDGMEFYEWAELIRSSSLVREEQHYKPSLRSHLLRDRRGCPRGRQKDPSCGRGGAKFSSPAQDFDELLRHQCMRF